MPRGDVSHLFIGMVLLLTSTYGLMTKRLLYGNKTIKISRSRVSMISSSRKQSTEVNFSKAKFKLDYNSITIFIGSCFSENMSAELKKYKFDVCANPQGIVFNPVSISECLSNVIHSKVFTSKDIFKDTLHPDIYHSWQHHSSFSALDSTEMVKNMNEKISTAHEKLTRANVVYLTLGTSFVHVLTNAQNENKSVTVSNCHKRKTLIIVHFSRNVVRRLITFLFL